MFAWYNNEGFLRSALNVQDAASIGLLVTIASLGSLARNDDARDIRCMCVFAEASAQAISIIPTIYLTTRYSVLSRGGYLFHGAWNR